MGVLRARPRPGIGAVTRRECGCEWEVIPVAEQPECVRQAGFGNPVARFTRRCNDHDSMCRSLEPWELNLFDEVQPDTERLDADTIASIMAIVDGPVIPEMEIPMSDEVQP